jgi:hypothetical protein
MQLDSQYLHCIQKAPTQGVGRTKPHPERFGRLVEGISQSKTSRFNEIPKAVILNHIVSLLLPEKLNRLFFESHAEIEQVEVLKK